jgi:hypothetical protein
MSDSPAAAPISLNEAKGWTGFRLDEVDGAGVGQLHGLFVDAESGEPTWLIAKLGRFGGSLVAIPVSDCAGGAGRVWSAHRRSTMRSAPVVDPTRPLLREHELTICSHYGIGEQIGRAAEVVGRKEGSVTSQPGHKHF